MIVAVPLSNTTATRRPAAHEKHRDSPVGPLWALCAHGPVSRLELARAHGTEGREFESLRARSSPRRFSPFFAATARHLLAQAKDGLSGPRRPSHGLSGSSWSHIGRIGFRRGTMLDDREIGPVWARHAATWDLVGARDPATVALSCVDGGLDGGVDLEQLFRGLRRGSRYRFRNP
jgi:hypothetical protein